MLSSEQLSQATGLTQRRIRQLAKELIEKGHGERVGRIFAFHKSAIKYINARKKDRAMKDTKERRTFREFLKNNNFNYNGKWRLIIDGSMGLSREEEEEINREGGIDYGKTAADALFYIAVNPFSLSCWEEAVDLLAKHANCVGYDKNNYLPYLSKKDAEICGFSDYVSMDRYPNIEYIPFKRLLD